MILLYNPLIFYIGRKNAKKSTWRLMFGSHKQREITYKSINSVRANFPTLLSLVMLHSVKKTLFPITFSMTMFFLLYVAEIKVILHIYVYAYILG